MANIIKIAGSRPGIAVIAFIVGIWITGASLKSETKTITVEKPIVKTITVTKPVITTIPLDATDWQTLKSIDDKIIASGGQLSTLLGSYMTACNDGFSASATGNQEDIQAVTDKINANNDKLTALTRDIAPMVTQRQAILAKLGY